MSVQSLTSTTDALSVLRLFNEKVDKLLRGSFVRKVFPEGHHLTLHFPDGTYEERCPDEGDIDAMALTLRFFVQDSDGISLRRIVELYEELPVEDRAREAARRARQSVNAYLDSPFPWVIQDEKLTYGRVFDSFLYGGLAHAEGNKKPDYDAWNEEPLLAAIMKFQFVEIARNLIFVLASFRAMNLRTIRQLESPQSASPQA